MQHHLTCSASPSLLSPVLCFSCEQSAVPRCLDDCCYSEVLQTARCACADSLCRSIFVAVPASEHLQMLPAQCQAALALGPHERQAFEHSTLHAQRSGEAPWRAARSPQIAVRGSSCQPPQSLSFELHHLHALHVTVFDTLPPVPCAFSSARVADVTPSLVLDCVPWPTLCSFLPPKWNAASAAP